MQISPDSVEPWDASRPAPQGVTEPEMHVSQLPLILDLPPLSLRDALRELRQYDYRGILDIEAIGAAFGARGQRLGRLIKALTAAGLIDPDPARPARWVITASGRRAANANGARPISRGRALAITADAVRRALAHNAAEPPYVVEAIGLFGSATTGVAKCADVDVAFALRRVPESDVEHEQRRERSLARAKEAGRQFRSWFDEHFWPEREARLALTRGSAYINLHERDEVARLEGAVVQWLLEDGWLTTTAGETLLAQTPATQSTAATTRRRAQRARLAAITLDDWWETEWPLDEELRSGETAEACAVRLGHAMAAQGAEIMLIAGRGRRRRMIRIRQRWRDVFRQPAIMMDSASRALDLLHVAGLPLTSELERAARRRLRHLHAEYYEELAATESDPP